VLLTVSIKYSASGDFLRKSIISFEEIPRAFEISSTVAPYKNPCGCLISAIKFCARYCSDISG